MKFGSLLSDELREKYNKKTIRPRKGDSVKIVRGGFRESKGKVTAVQRQPGKLSSKASTARRWAGGTARADRCVKVVVTSVQPRRQTEEEKGAGE